MESHYTCYYLDGAAARKKTELDLELVFAYFHLNLSTDGIGAGAERCGFSVLGRGHKMGGLYKYYTATLCKYIHRLT